LPAASLSDIYPLFAFLRTFHFSTVERGLGRFHPRPPPPFPGRTRFSHPCFFFKEKKFGSYLPFVLAGPRSSSHDRFVEEIIDSERV